MLELFSLFMRSYPKYEVVFSYHLLKTEQGLKDWQNTQKICTKTKDFQTSIKWLKYVNQIDSVTPPKSYPVTLIFRFNWDNSWELWNMKLEYYYEYL
jgi:hypothetical protein